MADFGTDVSTYVMGDLDPSFGIISGRRVVAEAVGRLWTSAKGTIITDIDAGVDVRQLLSSPVDDNTQNELSQILRNEALRDERVLDIAVEVRLNAPLQRLSIRGAITTSDEVFEFVFAASPDSLDLLEPVA